MPDLFDHFDRQILALADARIFLRIGGDGPPLLLLHGFPQCHVHWHAIAPLLAEHYTLVMPDLPGYGDSLGPVPDRDHQAYSKRSMANGMVELMAQLGFERFRLAGHDRGARVAYRLALDHPARVSHLASLDTIPTLDVWSSMDASAAIDAFHWPLLAQPAPLPERLIGADPVFFVDSLLARWCGRATPLAEAALAEYRRHVAKPSVITAMAEDYRAGAGVDLEHDREDRARGRKIACPVLVPWGRQYTGQSPLGVWRRWADDVDTVALDCGHFLAEEAPAACAEALLGFFARQ